MKLSYKWLQSYFDKPLPSPEDLAKLLTMQLCEIEGVEKVGDDFQIDTKELPDRSCYLLGHKFYADEIGALLNIKPKEFSVEGLSNPKESIEAKTGFENKCQDGCRRNVTRVVNGVGIKESPAWLKERLVTTGQRSINFIVDVTNFVAYEIGEAMHAFDKDTIKGQLHVRYANDGEKLTTLDGKIVNFTNEMMTIADDRGPLDVAGIKGGDDSAVSDATTSIVLLAANYDQIKIRKTAQKVGIRNDSSKRFENGVTPERALMAIELASALIALEYPNAQFGPIEDVYQNPVKERVITIDPNKIRKLLGIDISDEDIISILDRAGLKPDNWNITVPLHRADITDNADVAEEVGRIYGYNKLPHAPLATVSKVDVNKTFSISNKIRKFLQEKGFNEVYTHTLVASAKEVLANPLNADRGTLRDNLAEGLSDNIRLNIRHKDYLGIKDVKVFEIGHTYDPREHASLAFGIGATKGEKILGQKDALGAIVNELALALGVSGIETHVTILDFVCEINLEALISQIVSPEQEVIVEGKVGTIYEPLSPFPYSIRDVAVFVPGEATEARKVLDVITSNAGEYLHKAFLFDVFTKNKEGELVRTSYGYRMVFQAKDKTLSEEEISSAVTKVNSALAAQVEWVVR